MIAVLALMTALAADGTDFGRCPRFQGVRPWFPAPPSSCGRVGHEQRAHDGREPRRAVHHRRALTGPNLTVIGKRRDGIRGENRRPHPCCQPFTTGDSIAMLEPATLLKTVTVTTTRNRAAPQRHSTRASTSPEPKHKDIEAARRLVADDVLRQGVRRQPLFRRAAALLRSQRLGRVAARGSDRGAGRGRTRSYRRIPHSMTVRWLAIFAK